VKPSTGVLSKNRVRFGLVLAAGVVVLLLSRIPGITNALAPLDVLTARITAALLELTGMPVHREAAVLSHPAGFSYEIYYKCTGLILALFLSAALLMLPGRWTSRCMNIFFGVVMVFAFNFVRLVSLFYIGVRYPRAFDFYHTIFWEIAMLAFVFTYWLWSMRRAGVWTAKNKKTIN